jgi:hypothetical protein
VLTDFYSSIRELEKLAVYTKGKYVDLDMGGLTNLWITALAPEKENRDKIVSIVFPRDIENIPDHCCNGMRNLRYVELPRRLTRIGDSAFQNCSLLNFSDGIYLPEVEFELGMYSLRVNCETVDLSNLKSIESASLSLGYNVKAVIMNRTVPPQIVVDCYYNHRWYENPNYPEFCTRCPPIGGSGFIYVPDESLEVYQTGSAWRFMAGSFKPLSELPEEYR